MKKFDYDLITIGAGSGGVRASRLSSGFGARVAVVEESRVGGTCVMRGCVPKKLLVYGSEFASYFSDSLGFGWSYDKLTHSWQDLVIAKDKELERLERVYHRILNDSGVHLINGRGVVVDPHTVQVDDKSYTSEKILLAVGGRPFVPDINGKEYIITSNEALDLKTRPKSIVIVGGGYISLEFAGIFNSLGSKVDIVLRSESVLRGFDHDIREAVTSALVSRGIKIHSNCSVDSIFKLKGGKYSVSLASGDILEADEIMYATGRIPNSSQIGLKEIGLELDENGAVIVDQWNRSSIDSIFAVGDVTDRNCLTPVAINEGIVFSETFFNNNPITLDYSNIPSAVFSQPQLASVGLTEEQANKNGEIKVFYSNFNPMRNSLSGRKELTMMKLVVDKSSDRVLGCHMVGDDAAEIIQGFSVALKCGAKKSQFDATVGIHPTSAEEFVTMR